MCTDRTTSNTAADGDNLILHMMKMTKINDWLHYIDLTRFKKIAIQAKAQSAQMTARDGLEAFPCTCYISYVHLSCESPHVSN